MTLDIVTTGMHGEGVEPPGVRGARGGHARIVGGGHLRLGGWKEFQECLPQLLNLGMGIYNIAVMNKQ